MNDAENGIEVEDFHFNIFAIFSFEFHIITGVFPEEDFVPDFQEFRRIRSVFPNSSFSECKHNTLLRLLTGGGIGDDDAGSSRLLFLNRMNNDTITNGLNRDGKLRIVGGHR